MNIFFICPVRLATEEIKADLLEHILYLENKGYTVYYPGRDTDQTLSGLEICKIHRDKIISADLIYIYYIPTSQGIHFDMGMAFMANKPILIAYSDKKEIDSYYKEFSDMLKDWEDLSVFKLIQKED